MSVVSNKVIFSLTLRCSAASDGSGARGACLKLVGVRWKLVGDSSATQPMEPGVICMRKLPRSLIYAMLPTLWTLRGHDGEDVMLISESSASVPASELR